MRAQSREKSSSCASDLDTDDSLFQGFCVSSRSAASGSAAHNFPSQGYVQCRVTLFGIC